MTDAVIVKLGSRSREYVWTYGHWTARRDVGFYYRPRYENVNGRWEQRTDRWDADRAAAWERDHRDHDDHGDAGHHAEQGHADQGHTGQGHADQGNGDQGHGGQGHTEPGHGGQAHADVVQPVAKTAAAAAQHPVTLHRAPAVAIRQTPATTPMRRGHG